MSTLQTSETSQQRMSSGLSLRTNFSWTFAGNVIYSACQWGMLVVLAKIGSPEVVGQFALALSVTAPIMLFANLQLRAIQATDAKAEYLFGDYLGLRLVTTALALLAIIGVTVASGYSWETGLVVLAIGAAKAIESISDIFYGLLQHHERMDRIASSMIIRGALSLAALGAVIYLTGSLLAGAIGLAGAWLVTLVTYDIPSGALVLSPGPPTEASPSPRRQALALRPRWDAQMLARLAWLALPLGFAMMLLSLNTNVPRYFIQRYLGERELGIFAAIAYLQIAGTTVVGALGQSAIPRLSKYYAAGEVAAFRSLLLRLLAMGVILGVAGVVGALVVGRVLLTLLYRPEYADQTLFVWLMVAAGLAYVESFLGYSMTAARYFRVQLPLFAFATGASAIACFWLIPLYGLYGAAAALILTAAIQVCGGAAVVAHALYTLQKRAAGG